MFFIKASEKLVDFFGHDVAYSMLSYFPNSAVGRYANIFRRCDNSWLEDFVKNKKVIELGANDDGKINARYFVEFLGAGEYVGLDPKYKKDAELFLETGKARLESIDGLSYLLSQEDCSALVCSFGVLANGVIDSMGCARKYLEKLCEEIFRVSDGLTFHITDYPEYFVRAGFRTVKILPEAKLFFFEK